MAAIDWAVVAIYCAGIIAIGVALSKKGSKSLEDYFLSGRRLGWFLAGTSMIATAFASDTPLFVTGLVRKHGIWGNWMWWGLLTSHLLIAFVFSRLWRRSSVMTEVEFVELRYSGKEAAFLRAFKAIAWGGAFNIFVMGALPTIGFVKIMQVTTGWDKVTSVFFAGGICLFYCTVSGLWGVVTTDLIQFLIALAGSIILAIIAVDHVGGLTKISETLSGSGKLDFFPPLPSGENFFSSAFAWFLSFFLIQWWAWKNTDGGGIMVQRILACKNEKHAIGSVIWFNIGHYVIRCWPWILVALASMLIPFETIRHLTGDDHEKVYPALVRTLVPSPLRGLIIASFLAAFMSTMDTHINWGSSYIVNDVYKRFLKKDATQGHYVTVSKLISIVIGIAAMGVAFLSESIYNAFDVILSLTAGIGTVLIARWLWWRVNAYSEIAAIAGSVISYLVAKATGISDEGRLFTILYVSLLSLAIWVVVTLLTRPVNKEALLKFCERVLPPPILWGPIAGTSSQRISMSGARGATMAQGAIFKTQLLACCVGVLFLIVLNLGISEIIAQDAWAITHLACAIACFIILLRLTKAII